MSQLTPFELTPAASEPAPTERRWVGGDQVIGAALLVLMVSLFLPWFSLTARAPGAGVVGQTSGDGLRAHSYLWAVLVLALIGLAVLIGRDGIRRVPGNLPSPGQMLVGTSLLAFALSALAVVTKPPSVAHHNLPPPFSPESISVAWSYGGFVAVAAAAVALFAAFVTAGPQYEASRADHAADSATG